MGVLKQTALFVVFFAGITSTLSLMNYEPEEIMARTPASVPANYDVLKACEKQELLWERAIASTYKELPSYKNSDRLSS